MLAFTESNLLIMIAGYMLVYIVMAALSVPGAAVLTLAGGALFGVLIGTVAVSFASTIGWQHWCFWPPGFCFATAFSSVSESA